MSGEKILVVDDSATIRAMVGDSLREAGYQVEVAVDGEDGLNKALSFIPDVVVLDLTMPGRDGLDVASDLKENAATKHTKIIMLTQRDSEFDAMVVKELGADKYLAKPFDEKVLLDYITELLGK